jgi:hypothetical protein
MPGLALVETDDGGRSLLGLRQRDITTQAQRRNAPGADATAEFDWSTRIAPIITGTCPDATNGRDAHHPLASVSYQK